MKRRASQEFDSLELLLDTICNTFGGVLFLAVLIIMLVHRTGGSLNRTMADVAEMPSTSTLQASLEERQAELQSLERAFAEYRKTLAELETEQAVAPARDLLKLRSIVTDRIARRTEYVRQLTDLDQQATELEQLRQSRDALLRQAQQKAKSLKDQLESVRNSQTRTISLPMLRQTAKREFPLIVRFGRLYIPFTAETSLVARKSNLRDFVILEEKEAVVRATPKPYAGLPIHDDVEFFESLRQKLLPVNNQKVYLAIGVWEDSFDQFQDLKAAIVRLGFEYRLVPVGSGDFIQESAVKETLVQ